MKNFLKAMLAVTFCLGICSFVFAAQSGLTFSYEKSGESMMINCNGKLIDPSKSDALLMVGGEFFTDYPVVIQDGNSLIPLRAVTEILGAKLDWNWRDRIAVLTQNGQTVEYIIGSATAKVNGQEASLPVPAQLINDITYIPARSIADTFNFTIDFDSQLIQLTSSHANLTKSNLPVIALEAPADDTAISSDRAVELVKGSLSAGLRKHYGQKKNTKDLSTFLQSIAYRYSGKSLGRYYIVEVSFYDKWDKQFSAWAYVDRYTRHIYMGGPGYGMTTDILSYSIWKYENTLPMEQQETKIIAFDEMNIIDNAPFVLVNFPEQIHSNALLETYYNHVENIKNGRVFISHANHSDQTIDYIIRFQNNNPAIEVSEEEESAEETKGAITLSYVWDYTIHGNSMSIEQNVYIQEHMGRFYNDKVAGRTRQEKLLPGQAYDFVVKGIDTKHFFTGLLDFEAVENLELTVFAVASVENGSTDYSAIATPEIFYDYTYEPVTYTPVPPEGNKYQYYTAYSGVGAGYQVTARGSLKASDMLKTGDKETWNMAFETSGVLDDINHRNELTEYVDIELVEPRGENGEITTATWGGHLVDENGQLKSDRTVRNDPNNYGNLGNWAIEYIITVELHNDTDTDKIFNCDVTPVSQSTFTIIVDDEVTATDVNNRAYVSYFRRKIGEIYDLLHAGSPALSVKAGSVVVRPGETVEFKYTYVLGTDCPTNVFHIWTCAEV